MPGWNAAWNSYAMKAQCLPLRTRVFEWSYGSWDRIVLFQTSAEVWPAGGCVASVRGTAPGRCYG